MQTLTPEMALELTRRAIWLAAQVSAPVLLATIVVGVVVNILQTLTAIRDMTVHFVPKVIASAVTLGLSLPWVIEKITVFFAETYRALGLFGAF